MCVVKGPMLSLDARGKFANCIVFQRNGLNMITRRHVPVNYSRSFKQSVQRSEYGNAIADWRICPDSFRAAYNTVAQEQGLYGIHVFLKEWFHLRFCCRYGFAVYDISVYDMDKEYISYPEKLNQ